MSDFPTENPRIQNRTIFIRDRRQYLLIMLLNKFTEAELRNSSRETLETLEYWLRHIIDKILTDSYGSNYLSTLDEKGNRIINKKIADNIENRFFLEQGRYTRKIDASLLDSLVNIICNPLLYKKHFYKVFKFAFPEGNSEARTFFTRLTIPRNHLSHANPISIHQVEQILCYSHDIIDSIKQYYLENKMQMNFNVPRFIKFKDSFGNEKFFDQNSTGHPSFSCLNKEMFYLRPGDDLTLEVEIDESFNSSEYKLQWRSTKRIPDFGNTKKISIKIETHHVAETFNFQCVLVSNKSWHRMHEGYDDLLIVYYRILPPLV